MSKILQEHHTKLNKTKKTKRTEMPIVSSHRQTTVILCAVQSQSPNHCQTTTGKVQSSARDGSVLTDDGRLFHTRVEAFDIIY